jgi:hypothetical protein
MNVMVEVGTQNVNTGFADEQAKDSLPSSDGETPKVNLLGAKGGLSS